MRKQGGSEAGWWRLVGLAVALLVMGWPQWGWASAAVSDYQLRVKLEPDAGHISVQAGIALDESVALEFMLNDALRVEPGDGVARLERLERVAAALPMRRYRLTPQAGAQRVWLRYAGVISSPVTESADGVGRGVVSTPGQIGTDGVFLSAASGWYPLLAGPRLLRFSLQVDVPAGWDVISQGQREAAARQAASAERVAPRGPDGRVQVGWRAPHPQDDIYLIAAPFTVYRQTALIEDPPRKVLAEAWLRSPDEALAGRYLGATGRYLDLYSRLLGDYPYGKFALVENVWQSGFGMPSFTLLGSRVLRLPFILHTSYPHEILHNWWGNSVYLSAEGGNWAEGLTAYLSDYLLREMRGSGAAYRREVLQRYRDFVSRELAGDAQSRDFPLDQFRGRHGPVTQAVGYGKAMMVFHMLRRTLGDAVFLQGLRRFYVQQRFRFAGWDDIRAAMEAESGQDLQGFFRQWLQRSGAPGLRLSALKVEPQGEQWRLSGVLEQTQAGEPYQLQVPLRVQLQGSGQWQIQSLAMAKRRQAFSLRLAQRPVRLWVDPGFDLFRRLDSAEVAPVLSGLFGAPRPLAVLPADDPDIDAWRAMVAGWAERGGDWQLLLDTELQTLPGDRAVLLLGRGNRLLAQAAGLEKRLQAAELRVDGRSPQPQDGAVVVGRNPVDPQQVVVWVVADSPALRPLLARKLPHYGKYGYLLLRDGAVAGKGQWPLSTSPLRRDLPGVRGLAPVLPTEPPLTAQIGL